MPQLLKYHVFVLGCLSINVTSALLISRSINLPAPCGKRASTVIMEDYSITVLTPDGESAFSCPDSEYILDKGEEAGVDMPSSCRAGACCECIGKILSGTVDDSDASFLDDNQKAEGYVLLCTAYPTSDLTVETHKKESFLGLE